MFLKDGISVKTSDDYAYFDSVVSDPSIFSGISCDGQKIGDFNTSALPEGTIFIEVGKNGERCGFFCFAKTTDGYEQHTVLSDKCRGVSAITAGRMAIDLLRSITGCRLITSFVFANEPHTKWYARKLGFSETGESLSVNHAGEETNLIFLRKKLEE